MPRENSPQFDGILWLYLFPIFMVRRCNLEIRKVGLLVYRYVDYD